MTKTTADGPATEPPATPPEAGDGAGRPSPLAPLR
ncbi:MAG: hypothetical protein QOJ07_1077, partial [Thermoleophilaceae bacterium]|nr:hypothetical protein [Thermoleophilaceae bacterium]